MSGKRTERVGHQLRDQISQYLHRGLLKDPRIGFVTISGVEVSKDLRHAKVFVSVYGEPQETVDSLDALQSAQGFLRRQLGKDLHIRRVPDLSFVLDSSIVQGIHISKMLQDLPEIQAEQAQSQLASQESDDMHLSSEPIDEAAFIASQTRTDWAPLLEAIRKGQRFLIAAHRDPDGDAIGSTTSLYGILRKLGKDVVLYNDKPYPPHFLFLPFTDQMTSDLSDQAPFDVTILCDCGEVDRAPVGFPTDPDQRGTFLVIDHHLTSRLEGDHSYNDPAAPAVGLLIFVLCQQLQVALDQDIAKGMYCAIVSDTGSFRYEKTNPQTFRAAADLLETGFNPWEIASGLFESNPIERQRLLARTLNTIELRAEGQLAFLTVTRQMMQEEGASSEMTDGFINFGRGVNGVEVAVLFREEDDRWKISFRSSGRVNVAAIAQPFGGGGHHNAAGGSFIGSLSQLKDQISEALVATLQETAPTA